MIKQRYSDKGTIYTAPISLAVPGEEPEYVLGDVNSDGKKDISDLRVILRAVCGKVELTEEQKFAADVEKDSAGEVNISDLRKMLRFICGKIESL